MINLSGKAGMSLIDDSAPSLDRTFSSKFISGLVARKNLLDNWDFRNPVNQRGLTEYVFISGARYSIDRWFKGGNATTAHPVTVRIAAGEYVKLSSDANCSICQIIEHDRSLSGQTVTFSVRADNWGGELWLALNCGGKWIGKQFPIQETQGVKLYVATFKLPDFHGNIRVSINPGGVSRNAEIFTRRIKIQTVKLELGPVSTLANDPPMDLSIEMLKCMRYFEIVRHMHPLMRIDRWAAGTLYQGVKFTVEKRIAPVVTLQSVSTPPVNGKVSHATLGNTLEGFWYARHPRREGFMFVFCENLNIPNESVILSYIPHLADLQRSGNN